jgi:hypothetical protein
MVFDDEESDSVGRFQFGWGLTGIKAIRVVLRLLGLLGLLGLVF